MQENGCVHVSLYVSILVFIESFGIFVLLES